MAWPLQPEQIGKHVVTVLDALARGHARLLETSVTDLGALATEQAEVTLGAAGISVTPQAEALIGKANEAKLVAALGAASAPGASRDSVLAALA